MKIAVAVIIAVVISVGISSYLFGRDKNSKKTQHVYQVKFDKNLFVFVYEGPGESSFTILGEGKAKKVTYYPERDLIAIDDIRVMKRASFRDDFFLATIQRLFAQQSWLEFKDLMVNLCESKRDLIKKDKIRWGWLDQGCEAFWAKVRKRHREFQAVLRKSEDIFDRVQKQQQGKKQAGAK